MFEYYGVPSRRCARIDAEASTDNLLAERRAINKRKFHILLLCFVYFLLVRLLCAVGALELSVFHCSNYDAIGLCVCGYSVYAYYSLNDLEKPLKCIWMKRKKPKRCDREKGKRRRRRDRIRQQHFCSIVSLLLFCGRALAQFLSPSDLLRADRVYPHVITCFVNLLASLYML